MRLHIEVRIVHDGRMAEADYLPDWRIDDVVAAGGEWRVSATYLVEPVACPKCGADGLLYRHGRKSVTFLEAPVRGMRAVVVVDRLRYRCRACGSTTMQPLPDMDETRRMSVRCRSHIVEQSRLRPNTHVAAELGIDEKIVRKVVDEEVDRLADGASPPRRRGRPKSGVVAGGPAKFTCSSCNGVFAHLETDHSSAVEAPQQDGGDGDLQVRQLCSRCNRMKTDGWFGEPKRELSSR